MTKITLKFFLFLLPLLPIWGQTPATVIHTEANLYQVDSLLALSQRTVGKGRQRGNPTYPYQDHYQPTIFYSFQG